MPTYLVDEKFSISDCVDVIVWVNEQSLNFHKYDARQRSLLHQLGQELYKYLELVSGQEFDKGTALINAASQDLAKVKANLEKGITKQEELADTLEAVAGIINNLFELVKLVTPIVL